MIVDDAARLHPRVDYDRAHELESSFLQYFGKLLREWSACKHVAGVLDRFSAGDAPDEGREVVSCGLHSEIDAGAGNRRIDLGPRPDDARVV